MSSMKKLSPFILLIAIIAIIAFSFWLFPWVRPAWFSGELSKNQVVDLVEESLEFNDASNGIFTLAPGFRLSVFSDEVINPRVMIFDQNGSMLVSETSANRVSLIDNGGERITLLSGLNLPHGLAIKNDKLYVAETGRIVSYDYDGVQAVNPVVVLDLPVGGRHFSRTIGFGPDGRLYISIGSSCNICIETDWRRTKILAYDLEKQDLKVHASGLRNAVFFSWQPTTGKMFASEMGRDWLGDLLPPDEVNVIEAGGDYGFPFCYGKNILDPEFSVAAQCQSSQPSLFDLKAHEAPL